MGFRHRRAEAPGRLWMWLIGAVATMVVAVAGFLTNEQVPLAPARRANPPPAAAPAATVVRPFAAGSPWNTPIPDDPVLDSNSSAIADYLGAQPGVADLYEFGVPIYQADAFTPRYAVDCRRPWGACPLEQARVPIPDGASPSVGSDGAMVIIDESSGRTYEFWQAREAGNDWVASWGDVSSIYGDGHDSAAVGAGVSRLAGVIRTEEIRRGQIDHTLVFSTDNACQGTFRYPATKTDGDSHRSDCIPQGTRIQLDPTINVDRLHATRGEKAVARALQTYGAYAIDNGGARAAFIFETPTGEDDPYHAAGFTHDYYAMRGIPWDRLRVLRQWTGA